MIARIGAAAALALAVSSACTVRDTVATAGDDGYCDGLVERLFDHAVCACSDLSLNRRLFTDSFDSDVTPYVEGAKNGTDGHVGSNVSIRSNAVIDVQGNLAAGSGGVEAGAPMAAETTLNVDGDLTCGGPLGRPGSTVEVGGSARVAGDVDILTLAVTGLLVTPPETRKSGTITASAQEMGPVGVPRPCRCDDTSDVEAVIDLHRIVNDNDQISLDPAAYDDVRGDVTLDLPSGLYFLERLAASEAGTVTIHATGSAALFIDGDITLPQGLTIALEPEADLDVFVGGPIQVSGPMHLGDVARPAALRLYVAGGVDGGGSIPVAAGSVIAGNLYAPASDLAVREDPDPEREAIDIYGSLVVNHISDSEPINVHHDLAVERAADDCTGGDD